MKKEYFLGASEEGFHRIAYTEWGRSTDEQLPIICLHGFTRNSRDFDSLAKFLTSLNYHLFCPDMVGRGDSDWLQNPLHYTYEQYIADTTTLIARTQRKQVKLIGTSMGGIIGLVMAGMQQSPIERLILNDIGPQIPVKAIAQLTKLMGPDPEFNSLAEAIKYYKTVYPDLSYLNEQQWQEIVEPSLREITPGKWTIKLDHRVKQTSSKSQLLWKFLLNPHKALEGTYYDIDLWDVWRKITCKVYLIYGERSDFLTADIIKKMQSIHPHMETYQVANSGHAPTLQNKPEQEIIKQWLS